MLAKLIKVLIPVALVALIINDGGHYLLTMYNLNETTEAAVETAAAAARTNGSDPNDTWQTAQSYAQKNGADVYGFELKGGSVHVWTKQPVEKAWLLGYVSAASTHQPLKTPLYLDNEGTALVQ